MKLHKKAFETVLIQRGTAYVLVGLSYAEVEPLMRKVVKENRDKILNKLVTEEDLVELFKEKVLEYLDLKTDRLRSCPFIKTISWDDPEYK
ncbi:MAG: hypothetical protein QXS37_04800, partial [Candidatus Aenigmatarchaeota archaeon]